MDPPWEDGPVVVLVSNLQASLRNVLGRGIQADRAVATLFGHRIRNRWVPGISAKRPHRGSRYYTIPSLAECRAIFEGYLGPVDWDG